MAFSDAELNEFRGEAMELLETTEKSLLSLENGGEFKSNFDAIFRVFHNLKGASGMMGLDDLGQLMHQLENLLNSTKDKQSMTKEQIDHFLKGVDQARALLGAAREETSEVKIPVEKLIQEVEPPSTVVKEGVQEFLAEALEITGRLGLMLQIIEKDGPSEAAVDSIYRDIHTLKGGAFLFKFQELGELHHAVESVLDSLRQQQIPITKALMDALLAALDLSDLFILKIKGQNNEDLSERLAKLQSYFSLYIASTKEKPRQEEVVAPEVKPVSAMAGPAAEVDKDSGSSIRVPVSLLDKLMALMGEMVLVRNQVIQYSNRTDDLEFLNLSQRLNVVTGEIQGEMMKTRMQPIGNVLSKFTRLVRELSKDLNKKIEMQMSGADTELDKTLLEAVKDPLTHIVRNSCDHGIESPADRKAAGKPEAGTISIKSFHEGGQVIIEINDDGKGLHRDKLLKKAIEKSLITADRAATMSDREIMHLIFAPGFSTAAQVTNVSGRGVGMDVVRTNIEKIGGSVEVQSEAGHGTTMRLKIPLTLAIVPAMIVRCEKDYFAIPQLKLVELVRVEQSSQENRIEYVQGHPVFRLRGNILPLIHIRKVLGRPVPELGAQDVANIVVLNSDNHSFGLIVDDIQDTADIVVKPLARFLKPISVYSGATVLGDGAIALILDVGGIVKDHILSSENAGTSKSHQQMNVATRTLEDLQDFLLLKVGAPAKHAILLGYVHRLEEFKTSSIEISGHRKLVRYRNSVLPLISLDNALGLTTNSEIQGDIVSVVVIEKAGSFYGIVVQEILDVLTTDSSLDTGIVSDLGVIGNLVTDQEIIVVIDPYKLIQKFMGLEAKTIRPPANILKANEKQTFNKPVKKILYVEDAAFFRRHVSKALQSAGFEVTMANNGREACELLDKSKDGAFDLILSDIEMPQMNGFQFATAVRKNSRWSHIPLIALSTRSDQHHVEKGFQVGFNAYLEKMNSEELLESIADLSNKGAA